MNRRDAVGALLALGAAPLAALAQQEKRMRRIGYFSGSSVRSNAARLAAFREGMLELRWVEGRDYVIDARYANGVAQARPGLVAELVATQPDLLLTTADVAVRQLAQRTKTIPIVFAVIQDPLGNRVVASLQRPGGNATGLTSLARDLGAKLLPRASKPGATRTAAASFARIDFVRDFTLVAPSENARRLMESRGSSPQKTLVGPRMKRAQDCFSGVMSSITAGALILATAWASGSEYPARPVTLITPTTAGGAIDSSSRLLADRLTQKMGQRFVVENRPGGSGVIGASLAVRAKPDGHTLLFSSNTSMVSAPLMMKSVPYDPLVDLAPITEVGRIQLVLVTHPSMKLSTLKEFIAAAKAAPGRIQYASGGEGSDHHLSMELFTTAAGIKLSHVPYKAGPQGFADLLGGHIMAMFIAPGTAVRHVKDGKLAALGISSARVLEGYAGVPPVSSVLPGYEYEGWFATFAPKGTPADIVARLNAEIRAIIALPDVVQKLNAIGISPKTGTPEELTAMLVSNSEKIAKLMKQIGIEAR